MRIAVYVRVSTQRQVLAQTSEQQLERLRARIQEAGWTLPDENLFRDDGYSGATLNRPGLDRLRDKARARELDRVLITAPDRLARNYVHQMVLLEELEATGCTVEFLDRPMSQDPHDQLLLQIRGAVAEYERTLIAERMRRGRQRKLQAGAMLPWTHVPYAYRVDPERPRDPAGVQREETEAALVQEMFAWYLDKQASLAGLTRHLQSLGLPSPRGLHRWNQATVRGILTNAAYTGQVYMGRTQLHAPRQRRSATHPIGRPAYGRTATPREAWIPIATIPAVVSQEIFDQVQAKLRHNQQFARRNNTAYQYLLRALVSCGVCNLGCTGRGKAQYLYYVCRGKAPASQSCRDERCSARLIPARALDELVWQDLCEVLAHPELITQALERAHGGHWLPQELQARREQLHKGRVNLEHQLDRLSEAYLHSIIPLAEFERRRRDLDQKGQALETQEKQLEAHVNRQAELAGLAVSVEAFCQRVQTSLTNATFEQRRQLVVLLIDRVIVTNDQVEIRYVIPTSPESEQTHFCHLRKDYFELPTQDEPLDDLHRLDSQIGAQQRLGLELPFWVPDQDPTDRHHRFAAVIPDRGVRHNLQFAAAFPIPLRDSHLLPGRFRVGGDPRQGGQPRSFPAWAPRLMGPSGRGGLEQGRIQPKAGDHADRLGQLRHPPQQGKYGKTSIRDHHQLAGRQPAPQLEHHLPCPIRQLLVRPFTVRIVAFRRGQHRQEGQSPDPLRPRDRDQQHQAQPAQTARLYKMTMARAHWVTINSFGVDLRAAPPFNSVINPNNDWPGGREGLDQQVQQHPAQRPARPDRAVQDTMVSLEMAFGAQPHNPQDRGYRALARGQHGAQKQHLGMLPYDIGKVRCKFANQVKIVGGQGRHWQSSWRRMAIAYPALASIHNG